MDAKKKREQQQAKTAYAHRNELDDPYWETVWNALRAQEFKFGENFIDWRARMVKSKITPQQALDYGQHYGLTPFWKQLAVANVTDIAAWLVAVGLDADEQFFHWNGVPARGYVQDFIRWTREGYTPNQVRAWRIAGLTPDDEFDKSKPVVIVLD